MGQSSEVEFIRRYVVSMNDKLTTGYQVADGTVHNTKARANCSAGSILGLRYYGMSLPSAAF